MRLFNMVLEGVLNEIRAEDAYNRFYSSIPKEDFIKITGGEENIDKFIQFFLNCVRDGKSSVDEAVEAINAYKGADQLVKQKVKNKVSNGEYEDAAEVSYDVNYFSSGGAVLSRKKFAKEGYIKLGENERWICTCTTNYCANNHYYGSSHWCTASDRMGRYDGYRYFKNYGPGVACVLIQFRWKGDVQKQEGEVVHSSNVPSQECFDPELGYTANTIPQRFSMFQLQIRDNMEARQICDWADISSNLGEVEKFVGKKLFNCIDKEKVDFCLKKGQEQLDVEEKYQDAIYKLLELRKEKRAKLLLAKRDRLYDECEESNRRKREYTAQKWNEFLANKLYDNNEIVRFLIERDIRGSIDCHSDEAFAKTNYTKVWNHVPISRNMFALTVGPTKGMIKDVRSCHTANGDDDYEIFERLSNTMGLHQSIVIFVRTTGDSVNPWAVADLPMKGPFDGKAYLTMVNSIGFNNLTDERFYEISTEKGIMIFDIKNDKAEIKLDFSPCVFVYGPHKFIFLDEDEEYCPKYVIYNETDGSVKPKSETDPDICVPNVGRCLIFVKEDWDYQVIAFNNSNGMTTQRINVSGHMIKEVQQMTVDQYKYLKIGFDNGKYGLFDLREGDFVFGFFGDSTWVERDNTCYMRFDDRDTPGHKRNANDSGDYYYEHECAIIRKPDGDFERWYLEGDYGDREKCDKYGRTEKDLIGDRNLKAWLAAGGHSPEAKAQMDAMWADRAGKEDDSGSKALDAWNDDDRVLDARTSGVWTDKPFKINTGGTTDALWDYTDFKDKPKDNWRGYVDLLDPTFSKRDENDPTKKRGLFYRIDKYGRPIDQPWYSEDEVPANLSDRPVPGGRIYENYNSLISLMNRMGLLD